MPDNKMEQPLPEDSSRRTEVKRRTRPASAWHQDLERSIAELSSQRRELRQQIETQKVERRAGNPHGEETLSLRTAHQLARARVLGPEWQRARTSLKQSGQRVRSFRKQLDRCLTEKSLVRERSARWIYWPFKAPHLAWKTNSIKRHLRRADHQRRAALKTLRIIRPAATVPETRKRIVDLTESLLVNDERLKHGIQSLNKTDQTLSSEISQALRLAPQLRALGEQLLPMELRVVRGLCEVLIPKTVQALVPAAPLQTRKPRMRIR